MPCSLENCRVRIAFNILYLLKVRYIYETKGGELYKHQARVEIRLVGHPISVLSGAFWSRYGAMCRDFNNGHAWSPTCALIS